MPATRLSLVEAVRTASGDDRHERRFLDFAFDGTPMYAAVLATGSDMITPIWLDHDEWSRAAMRRLLGEMPPDAPHGRVAIYACAECADLGCGALTVTVARHDGLVAWCDWGYQNSYEDGFTAIAGFADVSFDEVQYEQTLRAALDSLATD
jgi:hypothetical protein